MEFRFEKALGALLIAAVAALAEQAEVRHKHLYGGCTGELTVSADGVSYQATGKKKDHAFQWKWRDIQELELGRDRMSVLTYEDNKWNSGRDREYTFDKLPRDFAAQVRPRLRQNLRGRFIDALDNPATSGTELPAKLTLSRWRGANGVLHIGSTGAHFESDKPDESRTWTYSDIQSVSSSGPYDLAFTTLEKSGFSRASGREFRFQLKEPLDPARYQQLWEAVERDKGLSFLNYYKGENK